MLVRNYGVDAMGVYENVVRLVLPGDGCVYRKGNR